LLALLRLRLNRLLGAFLVVVQAVAFSSKARLLLGTLLFQVLDVTAEVQLFLVKFLYASTQCQEVVLVVA